jgi:hypothetical protein
MVVVNNMRANVDVLLYDDHDRAIKILHSLDRMVWGEKFEAVVESEKYDTLTVNELFSKLKSAEVDQGMTAKIEGPAEIDQAVREDAQEPGEHEEEHEDMLPVRQARTLCRQLPRKGREQGQLQAQVEDKWQVPIKA